MVRLLMPPATPDVAAILYLVQNRSQSDSGAKSGDMVKGKGKEKSGY